MRLLWAEGYWVSSLGLISGAELPGSNWCQVLRNAVTVAASFLWSDSSEAADVLRTREAETLTPGTLRGTRQRWHCQNMLNVRLEQWFHKASVCSRRRSKQSRFSRSCGSLSLVSSFCVWVCARAWGWGLVHTGSRSSPSEVLESVIMWYFISPWGRILFSLWFSEGKWDWRISRRETENRSVSLKDPASADGC